MKNMKRKCFIVSILTGLLFFAACDEPPDVLRDTEADTRDSRGKDTGVEEKGFQRLTIFNEDGSMENIRVPVEEEGEISAGEISAAEKKVREAKGELFKIVDGKAVSIDSVMRDNAARVANNGKIVILFWATVFRATSKLSLKKKSRKSIIIC